MTDYVYAPGEWTALAHDGRAAILDPAIDAESVTTIWSSLSQGGSLESWLEVLAGHGLSSLPSFGFVEPGDDGVRVVVRGEVTALVEDYEISAGGMRTWREHAAPAGTGVVLRVAAWQGQDLGYPLIGGLVLASSLQVGDLPEPTADDDDAGAAPVAEEGEVAAEAGEVEQTEGAGAAEQAGGSEAADEAEGPDEVAEEADAVVASAAVEAPDELEAAGAEGVVEIDGDQLQEGGEQPVEGEDEVEPDFVLDPDDVDEDPEQEVEELAAAEPAPWAVPPPPQPHANQWGPPAQQPAEQPWQPERPAQPWDPPVQPEQVAEELGDHDGYTMRATDLPAHEGGSEPIADHTLAPAQEEAGAEPAVAGPVLQLSLSTGQQVELDRPVLIGRAPESSRFGFGETPRLVTVPSPQQDISRTHVEIKLEGDSVLVTDLRSTNGTVVVLPGSPPRRLHPGESVPVPTGTLVDLGDGVTAVVGTPGTTVPIAT